MNLHRPVWRRFAGGFCFAAMICSAAEPPHTALLQTEKLRVIIADNESFGPTHRAGYNGVAEMALAREGRNVFVPQYAGLNLEHIFSGDARSFAWNIFLIKPSSTDRE